VQLSCGEASTGLLLRVAQEFACSVQTALPPSLSSVRSLHDTTQPLFSARSCAAPRSGCLLRRAPFRSGNTMSLSDLLSRTVRPVPAAFVTLDLNRKTFAAFSTYAPITWGPRCRRLISIPLTRPVLLINLPRPHDLYTIKNKN
jgi:hypothetical protein